MHWNKTSDCVPSLPHGLGHQETGDCRQQLCVKCCFSTKSCQQMEFWTIHRANVLHSTDSKIDRETADIHISVNSSAKVVFLLLPKVFMILLGHVMHYTGRGWHQIFFFYCCFLSIALSMRDSFITAQTKKASQWERLPHLTELVLRNCPLQFNPHFSAYLHPFVCRAKLLLKYENRNDWQKIIYSINKWNQPKQWHFFVHYPGHIF